MMKRVTWFVGGMAAGVAGVGAAKRKVRRVTNDLVPLQLARKAGTQVTDRTGRVAEAVREGKRAMRLKEMELRARVEGRHSTLADELDDIETVLVDGKPVEAGQVIVLRQVKSQDRGSRVSRIARRA
ncbi:MAG: hypothetical protein R2713_23520 [Ilumatobacteraceae bacterium]